MKKSFSETLETCPDLAQCFEQFHACIWSQQHVPAATLELCRLRIAQILSSEVDLGVRHQSTLAALSAEKIAELGVYYKSALFSDIEKACIEMAECFVLDPATITDELANQVIDELGEAAYVALLEACGVFDGFTRFRLLLACDSLWGDYLAEGEVLAPVAAKTREKSPASSIRVMALDSATGSMVRDSPLNQVPETLEAFLAFYQCLWQGRYLRPSELEVARLRNASLVNCTFCKATRFDVAVDDGLDESRAEAALGQSAGQALSPRDALIATWAERFLLDPSAPSGKQSLLMNKTFSAGEQVALTAGLALFMCFSKFAVAMGGLPEQLPVMVSPVPS